MDRSNSTVFIDGAAGPRREWPENRRKRCDLIPLGKVGGSDGLVGAQRAIGLAGVRRRDGRMEIGSGRIVPGIGSMRSVSMFPR